MQDWREERVEMLTCTAQATEVDAVGLPGVGACMLHGAAPSVCVEETAGDIDK